MFRPQLPTLLADSTWSAPTPLMGAQADRPWSRSPRHWAHMQFALRTSSGNRLTWPSSQVMVTACLRSTSIVTGSTTRTSHTPTVDAPAFDIPSKDPVSGSPRDEAPTAHAAPGSVPALGYLSAN